MIEVEGEAVPALNQQDANKARANSAGELRADRDLN